MSVAGHVAPISLVLGCAMPVCRRDLVSLALGWAIGLDHEVVGLQGIR